MGNQLSKVKLCWLKGKLGPDFNPNLTLSEKVEWFPRSGSKLQLAVLLSISYAVLKLFQRKLGQILHRNSSFSRKD